MPVIRDLIVNSAKRCGAPENRAAQLAEIFGSAAGIGIVSVSTTQLDVCFGGKAMEDGSGVSTVAWDSTNFTSGAQWRIHVTHFN